MGNVGAEGWQSGASVCRAFALRAWVRENWSGGHTRGRARYSSMTDTSAKVAKAGVLVIAILVLTAACLEVAVSAASLIAPRLFGETANVQSAIDKIEPDKFADFAARARDNAAIWEGREGVSRTTSCLGETFDSTFDAAGARIYSGYDIRSASVLLIGDSYTAGDEVGNDHTIAAHLHKRTGVVAANLGVGGYSSLQAVLKLEAKAKNFPAARIVVLGIMHENIRRNVNTYMAVFTGEQGVFAVRPYIDGGSVKLVPTKVFDSLANFKSYARSALLADFWAAPPASFPRTVALVKLMGSRSFWIRNTSRAMAMLGRQYAPDYADPDLTGALSIVVRRFVDAARAAKLTPMVIFIPQNRRDLDSPANWIEDYRRSKHGDVEMQIMDISGVDWTRYNQMQDGSCHPSSYGYDMIAKAYAKALSGKIGDLKQ